jgi:hypothetical protein
MGELVFPDDPGAIAKSKEKVKSVKGMGGEQALGGREKGERGASHKVNDEVIEDSQEGLGMGRSDRTGILFERNVADIMPLIFNGPMTAQQVWQRGGVGLQRGQAIDRLDGGKLTNDSATALKAEDLTQVGPVAVAL